MTPLHVTENIASNPWGINGLRIKKHKKWGCVKAQLSDFTTPENVQTLKETFLIMHLDIKSLGDGLPRLCGVERGIKPPSTGFWYQM